MLIVADGASGLVKAIEQRWPASDRQRCCIHRARNLYAKLPDQARERVKDAYWQALYDAISEQVRNSQLLSLRRSSSGSSVTFATRNGRFTSRAISKNAR